MVNEQYDFAKQDAALIEAIIRKEGDIFGAPAHLHIVKVVSQGEKIGGGDIGPKIEIVICGGWTPKLLPTRKEKAARELVAHLAEMAECPVTIR